MKLHGSELRHWGGSLGGGIEQGKKGAIGLILASQGRFSSTHTHNQQAAAVGWQCRVITGVVLGDQGLAPNLAS